LGESRVLSSHSGVGLSCFDPKLMIRIDQANILFAIFAHFEKDPLLSTSGTIFLMSFNVECLVVVFGLPRSLLPLHAADNNPVGILLLDILMIFPRKVNLLFAIYNSTFLEMLNLFLTCKLEILSSLKLFQLMLRILLIYLI